MSIDVNKPLEAILNLLDQKASPPVARGWWLHAEALRRQAVPIERAMLTNCHDNADKESTGGALMALPIDQVLGWTESAQVALDFLTISDESLDAWLDMFVPVERRPSVVMVPVHKRHLQGKAAPSDALVMGFPDDTGHQS